MIPLSDRKTALGAQTLHSFAMGIGYIRHAPLQPPDQAKGPPTACNPPAGTKNGSVHMLRVPGGAKVMPFSWVAAEQAWGGNGGIRMAFPASYLALHGWAYVGPHDAAA